MPVPAAAARERAVAVRLLVRECPVVRPAAGIARLIRVTRWIWCTIGPRIDRRAQINRADLQIIE